VYVKQQFVKTWEIENVGIVPWIGRYLTRQGPPTAQGRLTSPERTQIPYTEPGQRCVVSVELTAPDTPGSCYAEWKMTDATGRFLLPQQKPVYVSVDVRERSLPPRDVNVMRPASDERYVHPTGRFERQADGTWHEYPEHGDKVIFRFEEFARDQEHIYLKDGSRRRDPGRPFILRIPIVGGMAQWSYPNPFDWVDLTIVKPNR